MVDRSLNYGRHHIRAFLSAALPIRTVVDLGAGSGADLDVAGDMCGAARRIAVEVYPPYAQALMQRGVEVLPLDIEREALPFGSEEIDVVIANQVLEHTKEVFWIFHEVTRVLKVGGRFILGVPNLASLHNRLLLALGRQPSSIKTASAHVRGFTRRDLVHFVESGFSGGFRLTGFGGANFYPFPGFVARPLAAVLPNLAWGIFLSLEKLRQYNSEFLVYPKTNRLETNFYLGHGS